MSKAAVVSVLIYAVAAVACATGGQNDGDQKTDAAVGPRDSSNQVTTDAPKVRLDGGTQSGQDAQVSQTVDAGGGGLFCTGNSQCTNAGECCVTLGGSMGFCGPGTVVLGQCVPQ